MRILKKTSWITPLFELSPNKRRREREREGEGEVIANVQRKCVCAINWHGTFLSLSLWCNSFFLSALFFGPTPDYVFHTLSTIHRLPSLYFLNLRLFIHDYHSFCVSVCVCVDEKSVVCSINCSDIKTGTNNFSNLRFQVNINVRSKYDIFPTQKNNSRSNA